MTTTFEKYAGTSAGNYSSLPTRDVEILPDVHHCEKCNSEVVFDSSMGLCGGYLHASQSTPDHEGRVTAKTRCKYCNSEEAVYRQHAWHDAIECPRCGGEAGYAIGD